MVWVHSLGIEKSEGMGGMENAEGNIQVDGMGGMEKSDENVQPEGTAGIEKSEGMAQPDNVEEGMVVCSLSRPCG